MEKEQTWRDLLNQLTTDTRERTRIAQAADITSITLTRWIQGKSKPRQENIQLLMEALPQQYRQQFIELINQEYPYIFGNGLFTREERSLNIPAHVYTQLLHTYANSPLQLRAANMSNQLLQQLLQHLDPQQEGLLVAIDSCVTPVHEKSIRSLRRKLVRASYPWSSYEQQTQFSGVESQAGHALVTRHPIVIQNQAEKLRLFPTHCLPEEESSVAFPILFADKAAGSFTIVSTRQNFFQQTYLDLVQSYVHLAVLMFEAHEFFDLEHIELSIMPAQEQQQAILNTFQQRMTRLMVQSTRQGQTITRSEAETCVWSQLEQELLEQH